MRILLADGHAEIRSGLRLLSNPARPPSHRPERASGVAQGRLVRGCGRLRQQGRPAGVPVGRPPRRGRRGRSATRGKGLTISLSEWCNFGRPTPVIDPDRSSAIPILHPLGGTCGPTSRPFDFVIFCLSASDFGTFDLERSIPTCNVPTFISAVSSSWPACC